MYPETDVVEAQIWLADFLDTPFTQILNEKTNTQTFYPTEAGLTKADVISMICGKRAESFADVNELEWVNIGFPELSLLTDGLMQKYVNDYQEVLEHVLTFEYVDAGALCQQHEELLKALACKITR